MPKLPTIAANAGTQPFHTPLDTALVASAGGLLFTVVGFLLILGTRRALPDDVPQTNGPLRRLNIKFIFGGDSERWAHHMNHVQPLVIGGVFMVMGGTALLVGLVRLLVALVHVL